MLQVQISLCRGPSVWDLREAAWWRNRVCHVIPNTTAPRHLCAAMTIYGHIKPFHHDLTLSWRSRLSQLTMLNVQYMFSHMLSCKMLMVVMMVFTLGMVWFIHFPQLFSSFCKASKKSFFVPVNWFSGKIEKGARPEVDSLIKDSQCAATDNSWHCTLQLEWSWQ